MAFVFALLLFLLSLLAGIFKSYLSSYVWIILIGSYFLGLIVGLILFLIKNSYKSIYKSIGYLLVLISGIIFAVGYFGFSYYSFINSTMFKNYDIIEKGLKVVEKENQFVKHIVNTTYNKSYLNNSVYRNMINSYSDSNILKSEKVFLSYLQLVQKDIGQELSFDYKTKFNLAILIRKAIETDNVDQLKDNLIKYYEYCFQNTQDLYCKYMIQSIKEGGYSPASYLQVYYGNNNYIGFLKYLVRDDYIVTLYKSKFSLNFNTVIIIHLLEFIMYILGILTVIKFSYLKLVVKSTKRYDDYLEYRTNENLGKLKINYNIFRNSSYYNDGEKFNYTIKLFLSKENDADFTDLSVKLNFYDNSKKGKLILEKTLQIDTITHTSLKNRLGMDIKLGNQSTDENAPENKDEFSLPGL